MWEERVLAHAASSLYDLDGVVNGRDDLRPWEDGELGSIDGLDLIHLQCHIGTDTVALARRGARTVGLDFSPAALAVAANLAERCRLDIDWVCADAYDAMTAAGGRRPAAEGSMWSTPESALSAGSRTLAAGHGWWRDSWRQEGFST